MFSNCFDSERHFLFVAEEFLIKKLEPFNPNSMRGLLSDKYHIDCCLSVCHTTYSVLHNGILFGDVCRVSLINITMVLNRVGSSDTSLLLI